MLAALAALAALVVSPIADTANFTITPGGPAVVVTVNTVGGTSTATFTTLSPNQRVSLNITNVTITSSKVSLQRSNGTNVVTPFTVTRTGFFRDVVTLPDPGAYKFVVDPKDTYTGRMTLQLYDVPADPVNPITAGGPAVPATTTQPGQNALFTFNGIAGHKMSAEVTGVALNGSAKLRLLEPDGSPLGVALTFGNAGGFLEPQTLPADGAYKLQVDPRLLAVGSFSVQLFDVPADASVPLTVDGAAGTATTTVPGQNAAFTFVATAGVKYSVKLTESSFNSAKVLWRKPDNTALFSPALAVGPDPLVTFLTPRTLTPAGTYTIFVNPALAETGSVKAQVFTVPPDLSGAITAGTPLHVATSAPGQNALYTFTGTKDHRMSLHLTSNTYESVKVSILKPDGTALFTPAYTLLTSEGFREPVKLPVTGTYKVKVDPVDGATGALDVTLYDVTADVAAAIAANGTPTPVSISSPGQAATLTFPITAPKRISLNVTGVTMAGAPSSGLSLKIVNPDGTTLKSATLGTNGAFVDTTSLAQSGNYKIKLDPAGASTGSATLTLYNVPADATAPIVAGGATVSVSTTVPGQNAAVTFSGTANQRVFIKVSAITGGSPSPKVLLQKVGSSSNLFSGSMGTDPYYVDTEELGATAGQFRIVYDPQGANTGGATFKLWTVPADVTGALSPGPNTVSIPNVGQVACNTFTANATQTATFTFTSATIAEARVRLYSSANCETGQLDSAYWVSSISNETVSKLLPTTGTYSFWIDPTNEFVGNESFTLTLS